MIENIDWKMNEDDEHLQEDSSSCHLLVALENLLKQSHHTSTFISKNKYRSKSVDDLLLYRQNKNPLTSINTRTKFNLSDIEYDDDDDDDNEYYSQIQYSRSEPSSPTKIYEKELAAFIDCDQQQQQQQHLITDNFIYNIDLSNSNEISHPLNSKLAIFFEDDDDDFSVEKINYEPSISFIHSSLINNCLTITEENEEELEQLRYDDDNQTDIIENENQLENMDKHETNIERLSTIYESPSPQPEIDDNTDEKLIVYDVANINASTKINSIPYNSSFIDQTHLDSYFTDNLFKQCPNFIDNLITSHLCGTINIDKNSSSSPVINSQNNFLSLSPQQQQHQSSSHSSPMLFSIDNDNNNEKFLSSQHITKMKVIQSTSLSLSDFISSTPMSTLKNISSINERRSSILTNGLLLSPRSHRLQKSLDFIKENNEEKLLSNSSSSSSSSSSLSSEIFSSSDEKFLSQSGYHLQHEQTTFPQRKSSSLKTIFMTSPSSLSKILYPIDFKTNLSSHQKQSYKVPTSDSGIVIDTRPTSNSSIEEEDNHLQQYEIDYQKTLIDLRLIKQHIVDIESRLNEAMRELKIEQALIEGEHDLVFKQILEASKSDQEKIKELYKNLQILVERIMTEKTTLRNEIDYTRQRLENLEKELYEFKQQYQSSNEIIRNKKEIIEITRKKYEDLEFQFMELETRCESELEQAEEHFQIEQKFVMDNAKIRKDTLHELDHQQYLVVHQAIIEKDKLEREKQKYKFLFKQKKFEANELEQKIYNNTNQSTSPPPPQIINKNNQQEKLNEIMEKIKFENMSIRKQNLDYQVKLREKHRIQERPLTRYLPIRSANFDLRAHIEGAGHSLDTSHVCLTSTSCRGYLNKMGGMKFKIWNRRWFVFDRQSHSLFYYQDKTEMKLRGSISFQSILEVYVDHLQSISLRTPEQRQATFIVKTNQRTYYLIAPTVESMRIWVDVMITGAEGNTFAEN